MISPSIVGVAASFAMSESRIGQLPSSISFAKPGRVARPPRSLATAKQNATKQPAAAEQLAICRLDRLRRRSRQSLWINKDHGHRLSAAQRGIPEPLIFSGLDPPCGFTPRHGPPVSVHREQRSRDPGPASGQNASIAGRVDHKPRADLLEASVMVHAGLPPAAAQSLRRHRPVGLYHAYPVAFPL